MKLTFFENGDPLYTSTNAVIDWVLLPASNDVAVKVNSNGAVVVADTNSPSP